MFIEVYTADWNKLVTLRDMNAAERFINDYIKVNSQKRLFYVVNVATGAITKFEKIDGTWATS